MIHEETKQLYLAYRAKAKELFEDVGPIESKNIHISEHANVQLAYDGAFVECIVWIAKEQL